VSTELSKMIVEDFLKSSWPCVESIVQEMSQFKEVRRPDVSLFYFEKGQRNDTVVGGNHLFLRSSIEYSSPYLTLEEIQGIIAARLLEVCGNYFHTFGLHQFDSSDVVQMCEALNKPPQGLIFPYLLNTDDVEPDRYSANPLRESIVTSGQSAFPCARVKTNQLAIDKKFVQKYEGVLVCKRDIELTNQHLHTSNSYVDMVDAVKYEELLGLSRLFGMNLRIPSVRMPLETLERETVDGVLHHMIRETHKDYRAIEFVYDCMGRSMKNLTTLLTVPHSQKGFASKRAVRGRIYFEGADLKNVKVRYQTVLLYENDIDPSDVSVARADDNFIIEGERFRNYSFEETPSSPQFFLYSLASPENAVMWHGIGEFGAAELLKSYATTRFACSTDSLIRDLSEKHRLNTRMPLQFNLTPRYMWRHPVHHNIDGSLGCISDLTDLANLGMKVEHLPTDQFIRRGAKTD